MEEGLAALSLTGREEAAWQFQAMRTTLANLWHPHGGVTITDLIDLDRFLDENPWTLNNYLMLFHRLKEMDDPMALPLFSADFWVQIHDLPMGLMLEMMARQFRDFLGQFLEYDVKSLNKEYKGLYANPC
ncbi:hypothetical protein J1N35_028176 [Gossypium stocksii]|uniref:DUF4283 domain-containing protein n=1 Tax=Gossypium stocksii TaxID=47602 RepID=A0A9D3ZRQ4_9ROSI|nr:hypothetical protein J1N35_028176 [Gossypium stocksii]